MSAPSIPPDDSLQIENIRQANAAAQADKDKQAADKAAADLATLRQSSSVAGKQQAQDFFSQQGLDPKSYDSAITDKINQVLTSLSPNDTNPGASFQNIGQSIYDQLQSGGRTKAVNDVNSIFAPDFETSRVTSSLDDPYLAEIQGSQRGSADQIIKNMLNRGVITQAGANAAEGNLDTQDAGVRTRLRDVGSGVLSNEQSALRDIANRGRSSAQTLNLGQTFDPNKYGTEADTNFNDFVSSLGDTLKAQAPGNLYNTSGLAAIAGSAQGAGNTKFDPNALAGITDPNADKDKTNNQQQTPQSENVF